MQAFFFQVPLRLGSLLCLSAVVEPYYLNLSLRAVARYRGREASVLGQSSVNAARQRGL